MDHEGLALEKDSFEGSKICYGGHDTRSHIVQEARHLIISATVPGLVIAKLNFAKVATPLSINEVTQGSDNPQSSACWAKVASDPAVKKEPSARYRHFSD